MFSTKEEFDGEAVPTGGGNTVGFLKSDVRIKVENGTDFFKIKGRLHDVIRGYGYVFDNIGTVFELGGYL